MSEQNTPAPGRRDGRWHKPRPQRVELRLTARIKTPYGWQDAIIYNAGPGGIMLRCSFPPGQGTRVAVRCGSTNLRGEVRWSDAGKCGIQSDAPIDIAALKTGRIVTSRKGNFERLAQFLSWGRL